MAFNFGSTLNGNNLNSNNPNIPFQMGNSPHVRVNEATTLPNFGSHIQRMIESKVLPHLKLTADESNQLFRPLFDVIQLIEDNISMLENQENMLKEENQSLEELKTKLFIPFLKLNVKELDKPVTVCTSSTCAELIHVGEARKWHYKQRCHNPCGLRGVPKEIVGDPALISCLAMDRTTNNCLLCNCSYKLHMHVYYETTLIDDKIEYNTQYIIDKETALIEAQRLLGQITARKIELENEQKIIENMIAKCATFLEANSTVVFVDSFEKYLEHLIDVEALLGTSSDAKRMKNLKQSLKTHNDLKTILKSTTITADSVEKDLNHLYDLKYTGQTIQDILKKQKSAEAKEQKTYNYAIKNETVNEPSEFEGESTIEGDLPISLDISELKIISKFLSQRDVNQLVQPLQIKQTIHFDKSRQFKQTLQLISNTSTQIHSEQKTSVKDDLLESLDLKDLKTIAKFLKETSNHQDAQLAHIAKLLEIKQTVDFDHQGQFTQTFQLLPDSSI